MDSVIDNSCDLENDLRISVLEVPIDGGEPFLLIMDDFTFCVIMDIFLYNLRLMARMLHPLGRRNLEASFSFKMLVVS